MCHGLLYLHLLSIVLYLSTAKRRTVLVLLGQFGGVKYAIQDKIQDNVASSLPSPRVFKFFNTFFFFYSPGFCVKQQARVCVCGTADVWCAHWQWTEKLNVWTVTLYASC